MKRFREGLLFGAYLLLLSVPSGADAGRKKFGFVLADGWGNRIDTFQGTVTKDLVARRDTTIALELTKAEMDSIEHQAREIDLLSYPKDFEGGDGIQPNTWCSLTVEMDTTRTWMNWTMGQAAGFVVPTNLTAQRLRRFNDFIDWIWRMVRARAVYRALPRPTGGYL